MATRLWFTSARSLPFSVLTPAASWEAVRSNLFVTRMSQIRPSNGMTANTLISTSTSAVANRDYLMWHGVTAPLLNNVTISGTVRGQFFGNESLDAINAFPQAVVRVISRDGQTVRGTLLSEFSGGVTELVISTTAVTNRNWPNSRAVTPVDALAGDRLSIEMGIRASAAGTVGIAFGWLDSDLPVDNSTSVSVANLGISGPKSWFELSPDLTFDLEEIEDGFELGGGTVTSGTSSGNPPTITNIVPANSSIIGTTDVLMFDLIVLQGIRRTLVAIEWPEEALGSAAEIRPSEFVHDGTNFHPLYKGSTVTPIADGVRYTLRRALPWPSRPSPQIFAFDEIGQEL